MEIFEASEMTLRQDFRQSNEYGDYLKGSGWEVVCVSGVNIFVRRLGPVAIAKIQRPSKEVNWKGAEKLFASRRVMMCKFEPAEERGIDHGFKQDGWPLLATRTLRIELKSESAVWTGFRKDARYCIRKVLKERMDVELNNFSKFYKIWKISSKRKGLWIPSIFEYEKLIEAFGNKVYCLTISDGAGAVVICHDATAYYYYAGATKVATSNNLPYLVVWECIKEAIKRGAKTWDFEGIYDSRWPNKGWLGFSHFKKSFGGYEVLYPGCYTKWRWPF